MLEHVFPPPPPITAVEVPVAKKAEGGSQLENQKRKNVASLGRRFVFFSVQQGASPFPVTSCSTPTGRESRVLRPWDLAKTPAPHPTSSDHRTARAVLKCSQAYLVIIKNVFIITPPDKTHLG